MSEFLLAVTALLSGLALRLWARFFRNRQKLLTRPTELADAIPVQEPGLIAMLLPRPLRRIWNGFVLSVCVLIFGIPHLLVIWNFSRDGGHPSQWLYFHYFWTLIYWLALLAAPALVIVRDRQSRLQQGKEPIHAAEAAKRLWYVWAHGLTFAIACLFGLLVISAVVFVFAMILMTFGIVLERRLDPQALGRLMVYALPVWIPLAVGSAAQYTERLKLPGHRRMASDQLV